MTDTTKPRAALFARVSTEDQAAEGKGSIAAQLDAGRQYADRLGWSVVEEFKEEGVSGSLEYRSRPEIARMLTMAESGDLDAVVWAYADRQGRSVAEVSLIEGDLRRHGVEVHLVEGGRRDRGTADGVLVEGVRDLVAEAERLRIAQRVMKGKHDKARAGKWVGGGATPFGYRRDAEKWLTLDPDAVEVVRFAYARALAGDSLSEITRRLNGEYPTFNGSRGAAGFTPGSVGRWLTKPGYKGEGFTQRVAPAPGAPREEFTAPAPAIVTATEWADAGASLAASVGAWRATHNRPTDANREPGKYALAGRVYHEHRKSGLVLLFAYTRKSGSKTNRVYRCSHTTKKYKDRYGGRQEYDPCAGWGVNPQNKKSRRTALRAGDIEARTILELVEAFRSPEALADLQAAEDRRALAIEETEDTLEAARRETDALAVERARMMQRLGRLTDEEADSWFDGWEARNRENHERVARLEAYAEGLAGYAVTIEELLDMTVGYLHLAPGDIDEATGEDLWQTAMRRLVDDASGVIASERADLLPESVAWLGEMAARFGVRVLIEHRDGSEYAYRFVGDRGLILDRQPETTPLKS